MSWVIPAGPVCWLGLCFGPARHVLQQGHESGDPRLEGKKKQSVLCDSQKMHKATGVRFGSWSFPGLCPVCGRPKGSSKVCEFLRVLNSFPVGFHKEAVRGCCSLISSWCALGLGF